MRATVVLTTRARLALAERVELVENAAEVADVVLATNPAEALSRLVPGTVAYLLGINALTAGVGAALAVRGRPYVVDTGDAAGALARATRGRLAGFAHGSAERLLVRHSLAVVCRGSFHQPVLRARTRSPLWWAPDTVPDELVNDISPEAPCLRLVSTFGSTPSPRRGDRAYGWEVIDLVAAVPGLQGLVVAAGPGIAALRERASRLGVSARVTVEGPRPLRELARLLRPAAFVTSVQSDDLAGWVRTTGKLPIALGLGKVPVTTRVGEATRVVPDHLLVEPGDDAVLVRRMAAVVAQGVPEGWTAEAHHLAEPFRRSRVAAGLRRFLGSL